MGPDDLLPQLALLHKMGHYIGTYWKFPHPIYIINGTLFYSKIILGKLFTCVLQRTVYTYGNI
jgi:hypothetical protein